MSQHSNDLDQHVRDYFADLDIRNECPQCGSPEWFAQDISYETGKHLDQKVNITLVICFHCHYIRPFWAIH